LTVYAVCSIVPAPCRRGFVTSVNTQTFAHRLFEFITVCLCLLTLLPATSHAQFKCLETKDLKLIYYGEINKYLVPHTARCFENSLALHERLFNYHSKEKITVLLHDMSDYGNGGTSTAPRNHISIAIAPFSYVYESAPANERMNATMNHELLHVVAGDRAVGSDNFFRTLFMGKVREDPDQPLSMLYSHLTVPRRSAPRWYHEGIAVFMETWMAGGLGRALGPYDEMVFRTRVLEDAPIYDLVGLETEGTKIDFQLTVNAYLYGTRFVSYVALKYGPERLLQWMARQQGSKSYFASDFKRIFGLSLSRAWHDWIAWEHEFQSRNLELIREYPTTEYRQIADQALGSISRACFDPELRELYVAVNYPGSISHIAAINIDNGSMRKICDIKGAAMFFVGSLAYDEKHKQLFYTSDNNEWRDLNVVDVRSGKSRLLQKDSRVGDLAFCDADSTLWGVRHSAGISTLVRIPYPYDKWHQVYSWPYGRDIYDIDVSHDGSTLTSALSEISGRQTLIQMNVNDLMQGDTSYTILYDFKNSSPANFVHSPDDRYLLGSSYYTGVSNIWRYDSELDSMEILSNCESGLFRPLPYSADSLIAFRFTANGFTPVMFKAQPLTDVNAIIYQGQEIVDKYPVVKTWIAGSPADVNLDSLTTYEGDYHSFLNVNLTSAYPVVEGYGDYVAYGMRANLSDPLVFHDIKLTASYSPNRRIAQDERFHGSVKYSHLAWAFDANYNVADFYDLFGPTKTSRKGYSGTVSYRGSLLMDGPKTAGYGFQFSGYGGLEKLPAYQNITTSFDRFLSLASYVNYRNERASIGAVDYERGIFWHLSGNSKYVNRKFFPRVYSTLDLGTNLPVDHTSVWLRSSIGGSPSSRIEPLANFYFGGFGNNWVDHGASKRYRDYSSFPGLELNQAGGTTFVKSIFELNLPPLRFRQLGIPSFYASWARTSLFVSGLATNFDKKALRTRYLDLGGQIDLKLIMLSHQDLTLSAGYAVAVEIHQRRQTELMVSLKIL